MSLLVYVRSFTKRELGIFTGSRAVDGKEMYKMRDARAKLLFCLVKLLLFSHFSSLLHLKLPVIYDTL